MQGLEIFQYLINMENTSQNVLCIASEKLFAQGKWQGLNKSDQDYYYKLLKEASEFKQRDILETDGNFKQIIPQVILCCNGKYYLHRIKSTSETRLMAMCPLTIGGHVEEFDVHQNEDLLQVALERELHEEVKISNENIIKRTFLGLVYLEDENPVNQYHVGLMYLFDLINDEVVSNEEGIEDLGFVTPAYLKEHLQELTFWSRIFVNEYL